MTAKPRATTILTILATVWLIHMPPALGEAQEGEQPQEEEQTSQQVQLDTPSAVPVAVHNPLDIDISQDEADAEARNREIDHLLAQQGINTATQSINEATQRLAKYTLYSTGIVGLGTVLLFITLMLTRRANQAAQATVRVTRDIGEAQTRAYLGTPTISVDIMGDTPFIRLHAEVANLGNTPAFDVEVCGNLRIQYAARPLENHTFFVRLNDIAPGNSDKGWHGNADAAASNYEDLMAITFFGKAFAYDVFGKEVSTRCIAEIGFGNRTPRQGFIYVGEESSGAFATSRDIDDIDFEAIRTKSREKR